VAGTNSLIPEQARSAVKLSRKQRVRLGLAEYVIARILELPAQVVEVDIQQPALPLAHLAATITVSTLVRSMSDTTAPARC